MAYENRPVSSDTQVDYRGSESGAELEEQDLEKLEADVKQLARKIAEYRATLPDQLKDALAAILSSQRPIVQDIDLGPEAGPSGRRARDAEEQAAKITLESQSSGEVHTLEKVKLLKEKISNNISRIPIVLERMKKCIARIEELESSNETIHPAFRKTS